VAEPRGLVVEAPADLADLARRLRELPGIQDVTGQAPLAPHTTWRVGGPADLLCVAGSVGGLISAVCEATARGIPVRVLGRGSNVLVRDGGLAGLVILNRTASLRLDPPVVVSDAGLLLSTLARRTAGAGLAGLEWCAGIPGSVGGALVSNAGAHGGAMADVLSRVRLWRAPAMVRWEDAVALDLRYRHSILRAGDAPEQIVVQAEFRLTAADEAILRARMDEQRRQRKATQPINLPTAGSVFKNPPGESAARLIDRAGLKGMSTGGVQVSRLHANFMVTTAGATAGDVVSLIERVRERVAALFGVDLVLEVQVIGREPRPQA
jgi:UDP-N-acetylmuramate dehydrogenase